MYPQPWWTESILTGVFVLLNIGLKAAIFGGFIFLLVKVASIDRTVREIAKRLDNR